MRKTLFKLSGCRIGLALFIVSLFFSIPSLAKETERTDILVGLKTLPMLGDPLSPPVYMGIVYDQNNPQSKADAEAIKAVLGSGAKTQEGESVTGVMVPLSDIGKLSQVKMAFVTVGLKDHFDTIAQAASAHNVLTMSADMDCVKANKCVLGIISKPVVEIYFSRIASETAKIDFDPAFIMLIKKV